MTSIRLIAATLTLTVVAGVAHAQTQAPGLWEHTFRMKSPGGEMEKAQAQMQAQLDAMPPEQRKQMDAMMKSRGVTMGAQGTTAKFCLTKEQAAKPPEARMTGDCKPADIKRSGNTMSYKFACTTPQQVNGEGQLTYVSDKAYTGTANVTTQAQGQARQMTMEMTGKWLGADCGDVKPLGAPPSK
jgi:hypothetical protein